MARPPHTSQPPSPEAPSQPAAPRRAALTLMLGTLASRVTGLLRNSLLNQLFSKEITDAFVTASKVPNLFRELLAEGALTNAFVPIYKATDPSTRKQLAQAVLGLLVVVNALLLIAVWLAAPLLVTMLLGSDALVDRALAVQLTRVCFPFLSAISLSAWAMGILQAEESFLAPAWAPVAFNIINVSLMLCFPGQALWLAGAFVLGGLAQLFVQLPALQRHGMLSAPLARSTRGWIWHPQLLAMLLLMLPFVLSTSGRQVLNVVANRLLSSSAEGAITAFFNADLFLSLALGLFSISPALAYYSRLAEQVQHAPTQVANTLLQGLRFIALLTVPAGLLLSLLAPSAVTVVFNWLPLFGRTGADEAVLSLSVAALHPLGLAVFPIGLNNLLMRSFYARQRVRLPIVISLGFLSLQAGLYLWLTPSAGVAGMAWATVLVAWLQLLGLVLWLTRAQHLAGFRLLQGCAQLWLAALPPSLLSLGLVRLCQPVSWWQHAGFILLVALSFGLLYGLCGILLRIPEFRQLGQRLRRA